MKRQRFYAGKLALVVGASEGIGRAVAGELAGRGCHVILTARRREPLQAALEELTGRADPALRLAIDAFDVSDWETTRLAVDRIIATHGLPDLVINCAGFAHPGWLDEAELEPMEQMMRVNYFGIVHVCKAFLPHFRKRGSGTFVNTSSLGGLIGLFGYTGYCASKFAVAGFSEALRREAAPFGISVTLLCPPNTRTPGLERENRIKPPEVLAQEESVVTVSPELVARRLLEALPGRPAVVIPTLDGKMVSLLSRWFPWLVDRVLARPKP